MEQSLIQKTIIPPSNAPNKIVGLDFGILDPTDIRKLSSVFVHDSELYEPGTLKPKTGGALDLRLGTINDDYKCQVCGQSKETCPGHFGSLDLVLPVFNIGFYSSIIHVLKCICKTCSNVLLPNDDINTRLRKLFTAPPQTVSNMVEKLKNLIKECEKVNICPHCGALNGPIRKTKNTIIISHCVGQKKEKLQESFMVKFKELKLKDVSEKDLEHFLANATEDLTPVRVFQLFDAIPTRQIPLLLNRYSTSSPSEMIIRTIIIPPTCIRPAVVSAGEGTNQDDLTVRLVDTIRINTDLKKAIEVGKQTNSFVEVWNSLQQTINSFINSEASDTALKTKKKNKPVIGIIQRLKGKQGRFRTNLSGKRVNFSGRTVISPDPNANVDQVVVPLEMAMTLTFPSRVTEFNKKLLQECVIRGPYQYPGANTIWKVDKKMKISLSVADRQKSAQMLRYGDIVERHLMNDDTVLFNRQPSLHRISIMGFRAKIMPWRTLRFNECACAPFNADFDGDEMNLHLPQTLEAAADAKVLMNILNNLFSPRAGEMIVAPTQDFLSGTYLVTRKNVFFDYSHFSQLVGMIFDDQEIVEIPPPAIIYPTQLWTGKQVLTLMLRPNSKTPFHFTHRVANKEYKGNYEMCPRDGFVSFLDNTMISGVLEKSLIGGGPKSLWAIMSRDVSPKFAAICMQRIAKLSTRYLMNRGFSIGITDVLPSEELTAKKQALIDQAYAKCKDKILLFDQNKLDPEPGLTPIKTLERFLNKQLSDLREDIGKMAMEQLSNLNTPLVMARSGAKGSTINIAQMMACVGQQSVGGQRIIDDFIDRTIPHFHHGSKDPVAKGFVANSFYTGMTPYEFFFHTIGGREGLVDSAVKTAQTGYMQRRLMKSLEDLIIAYDQTVRMADGTIVQFTYGDDGLDPLVLETTAFPVDLNRVAAELLFKNRNFDLLDINEITPYTESLFATIREQQKRLGLVRVPPFLIDRLESFIHKNLLAEYIKLKPLVSNEEIRSLKPITKEFIDDFVRFTMRRCEKSMIEPGTTVGAVAAQSIGEPATQMTLRSFHFAGVASMNVTLGVPRIEEVMNAVNTIKTPIITVKLLSNKEELSARIVRGTIERVTLDQVAKRIEYVQAENGCYIDIELDMALIQEAKLNIFAETVRESIENTPKLGVKREHTAVRGHSCVQISYPQMNPNELLFVMQELLLKLPKVGVSGIEGVNQVFINKDKDGSYELYVEGNSFLKVLSTPGVRWKSTTSNHILDVEKVLGIEAARSKIINEIEDVMKNYGLTIDRRHLMLLSDLMTIRGKVLGITRHGLAKSSTSSLKLASFETTSEHLFNASFHQVEEEANGTSTSVILGSFTPIGSGMVDILLSKDLIREKLFSPGPFLTPQPPSKYRDQIESNIFRK